MLYICIYEKAQSSSGWIPGIITVVPEELRYFGEVLDPYVEGLQLYMFVLESKEKGKHEFETDCLTGFSEVDLFIFELKPWMLWNY